MGVVAGTVIGAQLLHRLDPGLVSLIVGMTALFVAGSGLLNRTPEFSTGVEQVAGPVVGLAAGVMGGITGIFAPLIVAFVQSLKVDKRPFVFWLTASFFLGGAVQVLSYYQLGLYNRTILVYAVATFVPVVAGTRVGFWIQDRMRPELFRRVVLGLVLVSGLNLVLRQLR